MRRLAELTGGAQDEIERACISNYGSLENATKALETAMIATEANIKEEQAAVEAAFAASGKPRIEMGVSLFFVPFSQ